MSERDASNIVRPFDIGYLVPVVLLGALGGRRVGLLTLALAAGASVYVLTPPHFSWSVLHAWDWIELGMLLLVGGIVLLAVEALRQNALLLEQVRQAAEQRQGFLRDVLVNVTDGKLHLCDTTALLPEPLTACGEPITLTRQSLRTLRKAAEEAGVSGGLSEERRNDLVTATSECAMNAVVHAGGGVGRVCSGKDGTVQVWVEDQGKGIAMEHLPRATLEKGYTTAGTMGYGFKMMLEAADRLWLLTGPAGTTVVLEQDRIPPRRGWLAPTAG